MCDPITLALLGGGTALSMGGAARNNREELANRNREQANARQVSAARNQELMDERARQQAFSAENEGVFNKTLGGFDPTAQGTLQGKNTDALRSGFEGALHTGGVELPPDAVGAFKQSMQSEDAKSHARGVKKAGAAATLGGYGKTWEDNTVNLGQGGNKIDTTNTMARSSAQLLPALQDFRQASVQLPGGGRQPSSGVGSAMSAIGNLMGRAAGGGVSSGGPSWTSLGDRFASWGAPQPYINPDYVNNVPFGGPR